MTPRYGEVWEYDNSTRWLAVAQDVKRSRSINANAWWFVYLGSDIGRGWPYLANRMKAGLSVANSMVADGEHWRRLE